MKKYIYLFIIITLFLLAPLPFGERIGLVLSKVEGVRALTSLFSIQSAEAYTYQDVENAYNNAKTLPAGSGYKPEPAEKE